MCFRIDPTCALAAVLFCVGNCLLIVYWALEFQKRQNDFDAYRNLDVNYIEDLWQFRRHWKTFEIAAGLINALAWFMFSIPIMQLAWILSLGGKRGLWMHVTIGALAIGSCFTEFIARLFYIGIAGVTEWITKAANLDDWGSTGDGMGWRALEICHMITSGMILWVDAFEWLCLFGILTLIYFSSRGLMCSTTYRPSFILGRCWAHLGLFIGLLSMIDFATNILRYEAWRSFMNISMFFSILNRLFLLPVWLLFLGRTLSLASNSSEITRMYDNPNINNAGSVPEPTPVSEQESSATPAPDQTLFPPVIGTNDDLTRSAAGPVV